MEEKDFKKFMAMTSSEVIKKRYGHIIANEMTTEQLEEFVKTHNAAVYINFICKHQLSKEYILNVLLKDTQFNRNCRILGGPRTKENAAHSVIRTQKCFDAEILHAIIERFANDAEAQQNTYDYVKMQLTRKNGIANKDFTMDDYKNKYSEEALRFELSTKYPNK